MNSNNVQFIQKFCKDLSFSELNSTESVEFVEDYF